MKINLPDVTLIAVSSIKITETIDALQKSYKEIDFGAVKLISHERPDGLLKEIEFEKCSKINDIMDFNYLAFSDLEKYIQTSHALLIQYHAYIINPACWNNDWLQYDYIGAPWRWQEKSYLTDDSEHIRVGNGGFSLRSKKLLEMPQKLELQLEQRQGYWNEDGNICVYHRSKFLGEGIKYAPVEIAAKFSYENPMSENNFGKMKSFGFHKNMSPWNIQ